MDVQPIGLQVLQLLTVGRGHPFPLDGHFPPLLPEGRLVESRGRCLHLYRHGLPVTVHLNKYKSNLTTLNVRYSYTSI